MADDNTPKPVAAADFKPDDLTSAYNDVIAAQKAGDDDDFQKALKSLDDIAQQAMGTATDKEDDESDKKPDPFKQVADKYSKGDEQ